MGLILDTCVLIQAEKCGGELSFKKWDHVGESYISIVTVSELLMPILVKREI